MVLDLDLNFKSDFFMTCSLVHILKLKISPLCLKPRFSIPNISHRRCPCLASYWDSTLLIIQTMKQRVPMNFLLLQLWHSLGSQQRIYPDIGLFQTFHHFNA